MNPPAGTSRFVRPDTDVEDVQARADTRALPINRVGVKDISHPVRVRDRSAGEQHTIATFNMYVSLPHVLDELGIVVGALSDLVRDVAARLNDDARVSAYLVEAENFESIHNHSAYARIERVKDA